MTIGTSTSSKYGGSTYVYTFDDENEEDQKTLDYIKGWANSLGRWTDPLIIPTRGVTKNYSDESLNRPWTGQDIWAVGHVVGVSFQTDDPVEPPTPEDPPVEEEPVEDFSDRRKRRRRR